MKPTRSFSTFILLLGFARGFLIPSFQKSQGCYLLARSNNGVSKTKSTTQFRRNASIIANGQLYAKSKNEELTDDIEIWEAGNVYEDLDRLEKALVIENADSDLIAKECDEKLDHLAQNNNVPLFPAVQKFLIFPLLGALFLRWLHTFESTRMIPHILVRGMDFHFWTYVVYAPLVLLLFKNIFAPPAEPIPKELESFMMMNPYYKPAFYAPDWEDPDVSCRDNVLFLLEHWSIAVLGMAVVGFIHVLGKSPQKAGVAMWWGLAQLSTRIGAVAALYQYAGQMFQLFRKGRPRPFGFFTVMMRSIVKGMLALLPLGIASDLSKIVILLGRDSIVSLYFSISAFLLAKWVRLQAVDPLSDMEFPKTSFVGKLIDAVSIVAFWRKPLRNRFQKIPRIDWYQTVGEQHIKAFRAAYRRFFASWFLFLTPIIVPLMYIIGITRIFKIHHTHNFSLAMKSKDYNAAMKNDSELARRMKWRCRLDWRDDLRLQPLINELDRSWTYWLFVKGDVEERLDRERWERIEEEDMNERSIFAKIRRDLEQGIPPTPNRKRWKKDAMKQIAATHQRNYEQKTFEDPLGIAIHQTFGIGLGFDFDHMTPLKQGEVPSLRRLQARAAKSAIKRAQELYNTDNLEKFDTITDPVERERKKEELREATKAEIKYIGKRLTELVPIKDPKEFDGAEIAQFTQQRKFKKIGDHEYLVIDDPIGGDDKSSTWNLLKNARNKTETKQNYVKIYDDEEKDGVATKEPAKENDDFIEAYVKQQEGMRRIKQKDGVNGDDSDDDINFVLA